MDIKLQRNLMEQPSPPAALVVLGKDCSSNAFPLQLAGMGREEERAHPPSVHRKAADCCSLTAHPDCRGPRITLSTGNLCPAFGKDLPSQPRRQPAAGAGTHGARGSQLGFH